MNGMRWDGMGCYNSPSLGRITKRLADWFCVYMYASMIWRGMTNINPSFFFFDTFIFLFFVSFLFSLSGREGKGKEGLCVCRASPVMCEERNESVGIGEERRGEERILPRLGSNSLWWMTHYSGSIYTCLCICRVEKSRVPT